MFCPALSQRCGTARQTAADCDTASSRQTAAQLVPVGSEFMEPSDTQSPCAVYSNPLHGFLGVTMAFDAPDKSLTLYDLASCRDLQRKARLEVMAGFSAPWGCYFVLLMASGVYDRPWHAQYALQSLRRCIFFCVVRLPPILISAVYPGIYVDCV